MPPAPAHGLDCVRPAIGKTLTGLTRYVMGLGRSNDELGHGTTVLEFEDTTIVVRPGRNDDFIDIDRGPFEPTELDPQHWTSVRLDRTVPWSRRHRSGRLTEVECYTDGFEDVALLFRFDSGDRFAIALVDTDLRIADGLEVFSELGEPTPSLRDRIR